MVSSKLRAACIFGGEGRKSRESPVVGEGGDSKGVELGSQNSDQNRISNMQSRSSHICSLPTPRQPRESCLVVCLFVCNILYTFSNFYEPHE